MHKEEQEKIVVAMGRDEESDIYKTGCGLGLCGGEEREEVTNGRCGGVRIEVGTG